MMRFARLLVFTLLCVFTVSCMTATTTAEKSDSKDIIFTDVNLVSVVTSVESIYFAGNHYAVNATILPTPGIWLDNEKSNFLDIYNIQVDNETYYSFDDVGKKYNLRNKNSTSNLKNLTYDLVYTFKQARDGVRNKS